MKKKKRKTTRVSLDAIMRQCTRCREVKYRADFYMRKIDGRLYPRTVCKLCQNRKDYLRKRLDDFHERPFKYFQCRCGEYTNTFRKKCSACNLPRPEKYKNESIGI